MTSYELRSPSGKDRLIAFDSLEHAKAFQERHHERAKVLLRLFEVRTEVVEVIQ